MMGCIAAQGKISKRGDEWQVFLEVNGSYCWVGCRSCRKRSTVWCSPFKEGIQRQPLGSGSESTSGRRRGILLICDYRCYKACCGGKEIIKLYNNATITRE
jgi:hypothetical protein